MVKWKWIGSRNGLVPLFGGFLFVVCFSSQVSSQKHEASELPEDCGPDQFFNVEEARCQNCSEVLRVFEPAAYQQPEPNINWQPASGNQNHDTSSMSDQSRQANQNGHNLMQLAQRLPQLNGNKSRSTPARSTSGPRSRPRPSTVAGDAVLARLVAMKATSENRQAQQQQQQPSGASDEDGESEDERANKLEAVDLGELLANGQQLDDLVAPPPRDTNRLARLWQKLLARFLHSNEVAQMNVLGSIQQCKQFQNTTACQMWSNLCVLSMYAHSSDTSRRRPTVAPSQQMARLSSARPEPEADSEAAARTGTRAGWQECPKFTLATICNSLRDWHQHDRQLAQVEVGDIFADDDETAQAGAPLEPATKLASAHSPLAMRLNQPLQLLAYKYALDGQLLEVSQFNLNDLRRSFCLPNSELGPKQRARFTENLNLFLDNEYLSLDEHQDQDELLGQLRVGENVRLRCKFSDLEANLVAANHANETQFIDLFVAHPAAPSASSMSLKAVPVLVRNLLLNGQHVNLRHAHEPSRWKLVHRFFSRATLKLETRDSPAPESESEAELEDELLVYAKEFQLELNFRRQSNRGLAIGSVLLKLHYGLLPLVRSSLRRQLRSQATNESQPAGNRLRLGEGFRERLHEADLRVSQTLGDMLAYKKDFDLIVTILCLISCIWSLIRCYNIQKYQGFIKLDIYSLFLFLIVSCDIIANLILVSTLIFGLHLVVRLKLEPLANSLGLLPAFAPNSELESTVLTNLQLALIFKSIGLAYKLCVRLRADTFFIDWERPKMLTSTQLMHHHQANRANGVKSGAPAAQQQQQQQQVSFWRQYSLVNRWLKMQTMRRLDLTSHLILFACLFQHFQLDRFASINAGWPSSGQRGAHDANGDTQQPQIELSSTFRAVIMALSYVGLALAQLVYKRLLHEPMFRNQVREFIDLCSVSNVSLFAMLYPRFGYYVHGRNANGSSECGIGEMNALLEREERDLCSKRGLLANTDQQTFVLVLPKIINDHYRELLFRGATDQATGAFLSGPPSALDGFQLKSALNLASLKGAPGSPLSTATTSTSQRRRSPIDTVLARNRAVNAFLINYLEHVYKDIDYSIREPKRLRTFLLDLDLGGQPDEEAPLGSKLAARAGASGQLIGAQLATINGAQAADGLFRNHNRPLEALNQATCGNFYCDRGDSFTNLLWLGLELDLILFELLLLLNLDLWLTRGRHLVLIVAGLVWLANRLLKWLYNIYARNNLIVKSMLDEKFLHRS